MTVRVIGQQRRIVWRILTLPNQFAAGKKDALVLSLHASPTVFVQLKFPVKLNSFSDASRVCEPANESLFLITCRFRKNTELFSSVSNQYIVLRSILCGFYIILNGNLRRRRTKWPRKTMGCLLTNKNSSLFLRNLSQCFSFYAFNFFA